MRCPRFWSFASVTPTANYEAGSAAKIGSYARREQDWAFQSNLAAGEITQIFKQLRAAQIREAIAELELKNHRQQMKHAEEIEQFLNEEGTEKTGKKTNKALYAWMKREVKGCTRSASSSPSTSPRRPSAPCSTSWATRNAELSPVRLPGRQGRPAGGEKLYLDIKRMEMAYHDLNQREYELTKHVSLLQVDPLALFNCARPGAARSRCPKRCSTWTAPATTSGASRRWR